MHKSACIIITLTALVSLGCLAAYAQAPHPEDTVAAKDLGVAEPTLLPSSPLYFVKDWSRGLRRFFTFDPIKKAELELKFTDQKAAEVKKLADIQPQRTEALERAIENYRSSQQRLKFHFQTLQETSQNPNVDRLLEKLADRTVKHERIFSGLQEKFREKRELKDKIESATRDIEESTVEAAKKDSAEEFTKKLGKALNEARGGEFKHVQSIEILDRLGERADSDDLKKELGDLRKDFEQELKESITQFAKQRGEQAPEIIQKALEQLPGDKARQLGILQGITPEGTGILWDALQSTKSFIEEDLKARQREQIEAEFKKKQSDLERCGPTPLRPPPLGCGGPVCKDKKWEYVCPQGEQKPGEQKCVVGGCSGELCLSASEPPFASPCVYQPEFACYKTARCEAQPSGECGWTPTKELQLCIERERSSAAEPPPPIEEMKVEADDGGFYPSAVITPAKGSKVKLHFFVRNTNVYFGGLDFRSPKFKTDSVKPGGSTSVEFTAEEPFTITSYWPASDVKKADLRVEVR